MRKRVRSALWAMFAGDALAMPAHWFYRVENIVQWFDGGITEYVAPPHPHPEAFMLGMAYRPDVDAARAANRPFDILHEHAGFYTTTYAELAVALTERDPAHGNATAPEDERYHYHHGLAAGENTLASHLARVLLREVVAGYDPEQFLAALVEHLTTPGRNRDPYCEIYVRRWFENYSRGMPPAACAEQQRNVWSIASHGGLVRPMILSLLEPIRFQALGAAVEHMNLTHRSENNVNALAVLVPLLRDLVDGRDPASALDAHASSVRLPVVTGDGLFARYREAQGPGSIPRNEMWRLHTELRDEPLDLASFSRLHETEVVGPRLATACYPEHGLPLILYFARRYLGEPKAALLASTNVGGDNVHRNMVLGLLVGAAAGELSSELIDGLTARVEIESEIEGFVRALPS